MEEEYCETRSGSRSRQNSSSDKGSLRACSEPPVGNSPDSISTEGVRASDGDYTKRDQSMDSCLQNVISLPSDHEEKEPETVSMNSVRKLHYT